MQRDLHAAQRSLFAVRDGFDVRFRTQAQPQQIAPGLGGEIPFAADAGVVAVGMGNDRPRHGAPRIDVEIPRGNTALGDLR